MKLLLTYAFTLYTGLLLANPASDTIVLGEVVKVDAASVKIQEYGSPFADLKYRLGGRLGDALGEYSSVFIKRYGVGQLASLAVRGTSATQTEIQWNGIRLNLPSLGQADLSLFTIGMHDELQLVRTGTQGAIGGTLRMNNELSLDSGFVVNTVFRYGSFGTYDGMADVQYARKGFSGATRFNYLSSQNNFKYRNSFEAGHPYRRQQNAAVQQLAFMQQLSGNLSDKHQVNLYLWLTGAQRQIAPIMSKPLSKETQDDHSLRIMANWQGNFKALKLKFTTAYLYDKIHYRNPEAWIDAPSANTAIRNSFSADYLFPFRLKLNAVLHYDHEEARVSGYGRVRKRDIISLRSYADYYLLGKFRFQGGFRQDLIDKKLSAFAPEFSFSYTASPAKNHQYMAGFTVSRNFRFPTLNDLYWNPGGNPALRQERSWNGELQLKYAYRRMVDITLSNFYIHVNDWIQWLPQGTIWSPANFRRVFSRGFEAALHVSNAKAEGDHRKLLLHLNVSYTYTQTTNLDAASEYDMSRGMQLIYVPLHNVVAGLQLQYRRFYLRSVNTYTGRVFTSTDNSQWLKGYFLPDVELGKGFLMKGMEFGLSLRMNNASNTRYQNVAQRPMPGRNMEATVRLKFF